MKKLISVMLVVMFVLVGACSDDTDTTSDASVQDAAVTEAAVQEVSVQETSVMEASVKEAAVDTVLANDVSVE